MKNILQTLKNNAKRAVLPLVGILAVSGCTKHYEGMKGNEKVIYVKRKLGRTIINVTKENGTRVYYKDKRDIDLNLDQLKIYNQNDSLIRDYHYNSFNSQTQRKNKIILERANTNFQRYIAWADSQIQKDKENARLQEKLNEQREIDSVFKIIGN